MQTTNEFDRSLITQNANGAIREATLDRIIHYAAYVYIGLPVVIFMLGWIHWYIAVPLTLIILTSFFLCFRTLARTPVSGGGTVSKSTLCGMLLLICAWVYLSGIGGYVFQNTDHLYRNEIFKILVESPWPPAKTLATAYGYQTVFMSYYIGFWLPATLVGKLFGLDAGFAFQYIWSVIGLCILFVLFSKRVKKWSVATVLIFVFFSGLDIAGCALKGEDIIAMNIQNHIEWWSGYQFSSHTTQLFWVFNQAIYGWILTMLILSEEDNRRLVLFWSCGLLECTFPFVGMLPFLVYRILVNIQWKGAKIKNIFKWTNGLFSFENILGGGVIGIVSFIYLFSNSASLGSSMGQIHTAPADVFAYLLFIFLEAGVYHIAVFKYHNKNPLFWISLIVLFLCPLFRVGGMVDFCMRASVPSLLVLCMMVTEGMYTSWAENRRRFFAILAVFLIGAITPIHEIFRTTASTFDIHTSQREIKGFVDEDSVFNGPNFTASVDGSLFAKLFTNLEYWPYGKYDASGGVVGEIKDDWIVEQRFYVPEDITLDTIMVTFATYAHTVNCTLDVVISEMGKQTTVATLDCSTIQDNAAAAINIEPYEIQKGKLYSIRFVPHGAESGNAVTIYRSAGEAKDWSCAVINGRVQDFDLAVGLGGHSNSEE